MVVQCLVAPLGEKPVRRITSESAGLLDATEEFIASLKRKTTTSTSASTSTSCSDAMGCSEPAVVRAHK